ncbi:MAG: C40 family peptidase [Nocardiopsaceae bacterium]|nr:C40 family peptidase [Nocardiopsaceae bacterium]
MNPRVVGLVVAGGFVMALLGLLTVPMLVIGGSSLMFAGNGGTGCSSSGTPTVAQPAAGAAGKAIPSNYLHWYKKVGKQYNLPWVVLAGIGTEESNNGRSRLPGVASGQNGFGAAGPMQIGIGGASGNSWGGAPSHPASEKVAGVATDENGDGTASVYDPADAIAGAAKYLLAHGAQTDLSAAIFAYNHADWYVQDVMNYASKYSSGGFAVTAAQQAGGSSTCTGNIALASDNVPNSAAATAINYAQQQIGKPYVWGATGPDAFDCSGLVMMAYRTAGIDIARTSQQQWATEKHVPGSRVQPGDLVFFAGSDGTPTAPGHVGLVIAPGKMIEAYATGYPVRVSSYGKPSSPGGDQQVVGFTKPWASPQVAPVAAGAVPGSGPLGRAVPGQPVPGVGHKPHKPHKPRKHGH